jgi:hypothetical protein
MNQDQVQLPPDQVREIPKWSRAYASNRTLPRLVLMAVWAVGFLASGRLYSTAGQAYRAGEMLQFGWRLAAGLACTAAIVSPSIPAVMRKLDATLSRWFYASEGNAVITPERGAIQRRKPWIGAVPVIFAACVLASVFFGSRIPAGYEQPVSALYIVPFLAFLAVAQRPAGGFAPLLWALLYTLHALLILAGAPIVFHGKWWNLNLALPVFGYGILSLLAGHIYSRVALRRLRRLG